MIVFVLLVATILGVFFTMGMLGVARGVCDLIDFQGKFGKSCECHRLSQSSYLESYTEDQSRYPKRA